MFFRKKKEKKVIDWLSKQSYRLTDPTSCTSQDFLVCPLFPAEVECPLLHPTLFPTLFSQLK